MNISSRISRRFALTAAVLLLAPAAASAVTVTPTALYINSRTRSGTLTLINTDGRAEEVEISFAFGYPQLDPSGRLIVPLVTIAPDSEPSAMSFLRAFPRRIRLAPGQRQVVRITIEAPAGLAAGEYWGRVLIRSRAAQAPVESRTSDSIRVQIGLETVFATAVSYRNGAVTTGLDVAERGAAPADSGVMLQLDFARGGNAAFLGHLHAEVLDARGTSVGDLDEDLAVYHKLPRRFLIRVAKRPASWSGYTVRYRITTERPDLPADGPLPMRTKTGTIAIKP